MRYSILLILLLPIFSIGQENPEIQKKNTLSVSIGYSFEGFSIKYSRIFRSLDKIFLDFEVGTGTYLPASQFITRSFFGGITHNKGRGGIHFLSIGVHFTYAHSEDGFWGRADYYYPAVSIGYLFKKNFFSLKPRIQAGPIFKNSSETGLLLPNLTLQLGLNF